MGLVPRYGRPFLPLCLVMKDECRSEHLELLFQHHTQALLLGIYCTPAEPISLVTGGDHLIL